ncbi:cell division protein FtsZ [Limibacter armeniacum]|uniref:cell division protein FtsZ n=1 Tax=Limibacter armeniacum TaxID=466084 RepID=UPI002FE6628F
MDTNYEFDIPTSGPSKIIKVFGVGGGGGNAVKHMYEMGIHDVDFYICNTDIQALQSSPIPNKIQLGTKLTQGLGAGAKPEIGKEAAIENQDEIKALLGDNTKMVFITAGMGGGTGTGAAPVIAEIAKSMDILTVGIVTMPFKFEGKPKEKRAIEGINELKKYCDTVLVILNDKLRDVYGRSSMKEAFAQADNVLTKGAKSIAEIITVDGYINVDFEDVNTVMKDSGAAVMGSATESGEDRAIRAAEGAITSPLLNNTNIDNAKYILLSIVVSDYDDFQMEELEQITAYIQQQAGENAEMIFGVAQDESLGEGLNVTIIATGFEHADNLKTKEVIDLNTGKRKTSPTGPQSSVYPTGNDDFFRGGESSSKVTQTRPSTEEERPVVQQPQPKAEPVVSEVKVEEKQPEQPQKPVEAKKEDNPTPAPQQPAKKVYNLNEDYEIIENNQASEQKKAEEQTTPKGRHQISSYLSSVSVNEWSNEELKEKQETPAYIRRGIKLKDVPHSSESEQSRLNVNDKKDILGDNKFLHDNVD